MPEGTSGDALFRELWHACAGTLVTVPHEEQRVYYFPEGHMEQVTVVLLYRMCYFLMNIAGGMLPIYLSLSQKRNVLLCSSKLLEVILIFYIASKHSWMLNVVGNGYLSHTDYYYYYLYYY